MEAHDLLTAALTKAVMDGINPETQRDIFTRALYSHLFQPTRPNETGTPLTYAFDRALNGAVTKVAEKMMEEEPYRTQIREAIHDALDAMMEDGSFVKKLTERVVSALGRAY